MNPLRTALATLTALALLVAALPASAQPAPPPSATTPAPPPPIPQVVPYDDELLQLSEIMGALHFLTQLCSGDGTSAWRDQMTALLAAEQPDDQRRARLVDRFNRGFESYRAVYRECTDSARLAISRYQDQGSTIAADLDARYGQDQ